MPVFDTIWALRNGKKYETAANTRKSENGFSESSPIVSAPENNTDTESQTRISMQEKIHEQIRHYISPLTRLSGDMTRLIQGLSTARQSSDSQKARTSTSSNAGCPSPDMVTGASRTLSRGQQTGTSQMQNQKIWFDITATTDDAVHL